MVEQFRHREVVEVVIMAEEMVNKMNLEVVVQDILVD